MKKTKRQKRIEARRKIASDLRGRYLATAEFVNEENRKLKEDRRKILSGAAQIQNAIDSILIRVARSYGIVQGDNYLMEIPREDIEDTLKEYQVKVKYTDDSMCIAVLPR